MFDPIPTPDTMLATEAAPSRHFVYILECADGSLYTGWTTDLAARLATHNAGRGAKYTRSRLPVHLVYYEIYQEEHTARSREWYIKNKMSRRQKEALICASSAG